MMKWGLGRWRPQTAPLCLGIVVTWGIQTVHSCPCDSLCWRQALIPQVREKIPGRKWRRLPQCSGLENPMDREAPKGFSPWGRRSPYTGWARTCWARLPVITRFVFKGFGHTAWRVSLSSDQGIEPRPLRLPKRWVLSHGTSMEVPELFWMLDLLNEPLMFLNFSSPVFCLSVFGSLYRNFPHFLFFSPYIQVLFLSILFLFHECTL